MTDTGAPKPDWYPDPSGRFEFRYWDGETWTGHVSSGGESSWDPPPEDEGADAGAGDAPAGAAQAEPTASEWAAQAEPAAAEWTPQAEPAAAEWSPQAEPAAAEWAPEVQAAPAAEPPAQEPAAAVGTLAADDEDTNLVAIEHGGLGPETDSWLRQVAEQVDPRLARINPAWSTNPQAEAARACAFGLLLGHLVGRYPHTRDDLSKVAEAHPSFSTLDTGTRLTILEQIAGDRQRAAAWLGPLIDTTDADRVAMLFD